MDRYAGKGFFELDEVEPVEVTAVGCPRFTSHLLGYCMCFDDQTNAMYFLFYLGLVPFNTPQHCTRCNVKIMSLEQVSSAFLPEWRVTTGSTFKLATV